MTMIVWRVIEDNPWFAVPKDIVLKYLPPPGEDARTCGPGPFSMANQELVTRQLEIAGYTDIRFERVDAPIVVGLTADDAIGFQLALGPAVEEAMRAELSRYVTDEGIVMDSSSWKITARNPD
jgi:hypothetical protein